MRFTSFSTSYGPGMVFSPYAAPSTGAFERISPLGAPQGQEPLSATPFKSEERRE